MKPRAGFLYALLVAAVLALLFYRFVDLVPEDSIEDASDQVWRNPLLAAELLLKAEGYTVQSQPSLISTPTGKGTIIMRQPASSLSPEEARRLIAWVKAGNQLITEAPPEWTGIRGVPDPVMDALGVRLRSYAPDKKAGAAEEPPPQAAKGRPGETLPEDDGMWLQPSPDEGWLQVGFNPYRYVEDTRHTAAGWLQGTHGRQALQYDFGAGKVVVVSDSQLFENRQIDKLDNAALLLRLVEPPKGGKIWIFFDRRFPPLRALIWQHARPAVIATLVFAACWLWWSASRFGALLPPVYSPRRRLSEHLHAAGRYLWFAGEEKRLYKVVRQSLRQRLLRRNTEWRQLSADALATILAEQSGLPVEAIRRALFATPEHDTGRFLADMRLLMQLGRALDHGRTATLNSLPATPNGTTSS
jgi:hypothetical protein